MADVQAIWTLVLVVWSLSCLIQLVQAEPLLWRRKYASPPRLVFSPVPTEQNNTVGVNVTVLKHVAVDGHKLRVKGYLATSDEPSSWSVLTPHPNNCMSVKKTTRQARQHKCHVATNGGPFQSYVDGGCVGGVVVNGRVVSPDFSPTLVGFGLTTSSNPKWVLGGIANITEETDVFGLKQFVTGFGWLVYNGEITVDDNKTGAEKAPRTAIGIDKKGRIMLLVVNGCEKCLVPKRRGLTLQQLANVLVSLGAKHAINLDGGGSSTFVKDGNILNYPTCMDVRFKCERAVTTVMCLKKQRTLQKRSKS